MSVFSKLFSGSPKGETEATSPKTAEEGPSMQRPPNEGKAGTPQAQQTPTPASSQKGGSPSPKSAQQQRSPAAQASSPKEQRDEQELRVIGGIEGRQLR